MVVDGRYATGLLANLRCMGVLADGLHLHDAALRHLPLARSVSLYLARRVQAEVRMVGALISKLADAEHLRLERRADGIEQLRQWAVARSFAGRATGRPDPPKS